MIKFYVINGIFDVLIRSLALMRASIFASFSTRDSFSVIKRLWRWSFTSLIVIQDDSDGFWAVYYIIYRPESV